MVLSIHSILAWIQTMCLVSLTNTIENTYIILVQETHRQQDLFFLHLTMFQDILMALFQVQAKVLLVVLNQHYLVLIIQLTAQQTRVIAHISLTWKKVSQFTST